MDIAHFEEETHLSLSLCSYDGSLAYDPSRGKLSVLLGDPAQGNCLSKSKRKTWIIGISAGKFSFLCFVFCCFCLFCCCFFGLFLFGFDFEGLGNLGIAAVVIVVLLIILLC